MAHDPSWADMAARKAGSSQAADKIGTPEGQQMVSVALVYALLALAEAVQAPEARG